MSAGTMAVMAIWFGLVTGVVEGAGLLVSQHTGRLNSGLLLWVSPPILWISPLAALLFFGCVLFLIALLRRLVPVARSSTLAVAVFCFFSIYDWMTVAAAGRVRHYALVMLSLGFASVLTRQFPRYRLSTVDFFRRTLPWLVALVAVLVLGVQGGGALLEQIEENALASAPPNSPNILLIVVDALRADHLSSYGYARITSPRLDGIAKEGVLFENAFATSSWSLPSHTSLLTGRYPHEHQAGEQNPSFDGRYPVVSSYLKDRGYRTGAFSANTTYFARGVGLGTGFIHFEDVFRSSGDIWIRTAYGREFYNGLQRIGNMPELPGRRRATEMTSAILDWVDRGGEHPFFAMVNFVDAHEPYASPLRFSSRFEGAKEGGSSSQPGSALTLSDGKINSYDGAVAYVDDEIGRLIGELRKRKKNTLVLVTADHGELFGEHGQFQHGQSLYREVIRVPLIMWWPGRIPAGLRIAQDVSCAAIPATILSLVEGVSQSEFPGPSLTQGWSTSSEPAVWPYPLAELAFSRHSKSLVRDGWHYIRSGDLKIEIYDWSQDPGELSNLAMTPGGKARAQDFGTHLNRLLAVRP